MTSAYMQRIMDQEAAQKAAKAKKDKPRKGGDRKRTELAKAPAPPPAGSVEKVREEAIEGEEIVRLIFPCPKGLADRIEAYWHSRKLGSRSAGIRALLEEALR